MAALGQQASGLPAYLIRAVIGPESSGNPRALSPTGAEGLMQLEPAAAQEEGVTDRYNPQQNVIGGSRYLRKLIDRYHGNLTTALAAYNAGPGNVDKGNIPPETREYVHGIIASILSNHGR